MVRLAEAADESRGGWVGGLFRSSTTTIILLLLQHPRQQHRQTRYNNSDRVAKTGVRFA